jgi:hypothetical protein
MPPSPPRRLHRTCRRAIGLSVRGVVSAPVILTKYCDPAVIPQSVTGGAVPHWPAPEADPSKARLALPVNNPSQDSCDTKTTTLRPGNRSHAERTAPTRRRSVQQERDRLPGRSVMPVWLTLAVAGRRKRHVLLRRAVAGDRLVPATEGIARAHAPLSPAC